MSTACPDPSHGVYLTYLVQGIILLSVAYNITTGDYLLGLSAGITFLLTIVPSIVTRSLNLRLPWEVNLLIATSLCLHLMGHVRGYYVLFAPYYDKLTHLVSSVTVAIIAFFAAILADHLRDVRLTRPAVIIFILTFTLTAGTVWEICEFVIDQIFSTNFQHGNTDTMVDLIVDLIGAMIVALFAEITLSRGEKGRFVRLFVETTPRMSQVDIMSNPGDQGEER